MYHLIKKDLLMQKKVLIFALLYLLLFTFFIAKNEPTGLMVGILVVTYLLSLGSAALEDKNNSDIMLLSLPIKKNTIVFSKYLSVYIFATAVILINYLIYLIVDIFNIPLSIHQITFEGLAGGLIAVTLFCAISFPLLFKLGYAKSKTVNLFLFFGFVFLSGPIVSIIDEQDRIALQDWLTRFIQEGSNIEKALLIAIPLLLILGISYKLSLTFYSRREF